MSSNPNGPCVERRAAQRFEVHLPLTVHYEGRAVPGFIQDLSGRGIFFFAEAALPEGAIVELTFNMPSEIIGFAERSGFIRPTSGYSVSEQSANRDCCAIRVLPLPASGRADRSVRSRFG
jgi:hypothetical protein